MKEVFTDKAPAAIGPYSQAVIAGDFLYASGAIPINPIQGKLAEGIEKQTIQVMENLRTILLAGGRKLFSSCEIHYLFKKSWTTLKRQRNLWSIFEKALSSTCNC